MSLFREKLLYLAKGADICVFAGSLPRGVDDSIYARADRGAVAARRHDRDRRGGRADGARAAGSARPRVAERQARPRQLVGHEFRDEQDHIFAPLRALRAGPARGDHHARRGLLRAGRPRPRARALRAFAPIRSSRSRRSAPATCSWPATSPPATAARPHAEALRFAVACGAESTQHLGAGVLDPRAAERLEHEVAVTELDEPAPVDATA